LNATRAAVEKGIVPGGGAALLYASQALKGLKLENFDQQTGVDLIKKGCEVPTRTICNNAGFEGAQVVSRLTEGELNRRRGFNAQTGKYVDMFEDGIIDPTKVVRTGIIDASRMASLMITTECAVVEEVPGFQRS